MAGEERQGSIEFAENMQAESATSPDRFMSPHDRPMPPAERMEETEKCLDKMGYLSQEPIG